MKTTVELPTIQFKKVEIDLDELKNFSETRGVIDSFNKNYWNRLIGEIDRYEDSVFGDFPIQEFLEAIYIFLESTHPDVCGQFFNPYFQSRMDRQVCETIANMNKLNSQEGC